MVDIGLGLNVMRGVNFWLNPEKVSDTVYSFLTAHLNMRDDLVPYTVYTLNNYTSKVGKRWIK